LPVTDRACFADAVLADLALVILAVDDLARARGFYGAITGWTVQVDTPVYVELVAPNRMRLGLYERHAFGRNVGRVPEKLVGPVGATELYLYVEDLDGAVQRALAAGASLLDAARERAWGDHVAYVADGDGVVVAFARRSRPAAP
jgi:catechol 2,3-dioxygenase-like lactoylglutathione lyase family enzyme